MPNTHYGKETSGVSNRRWEQPRRYFLNFLPHHLISESLQSFTGNLTRPSLSGQSHNTNPLLTTNIHLDFRVCKTLGIPWVRLKQWESKHFLLHLNCDLHFYYLTAASKGHAEAHHLSYSRPYKELAELPPTHKKEFSSVINKPGFHYKYSHGAENSFQNSLPRLSEVHRHHYSLSEL